MGNQWKGDPIIWTVGISWLGQGVLPRLLEGHGLNRPHQRRGQRGLNASRGSGSDGVGYGKL